MDENEKVMKNQEETAQVQETNNATVIKTDVDAKDGQNKCPKCGATDISLNSKNGKLRCNFCRHEFEPEKLDAMEKDISKLEGEIVGSGATNIIADTNDMVTFKCSSCGAEIVVDTAKATQARCHWCRNTLSVNQQIPNGAIPDTVLPFSVPKKEAKEAIEKFVGKRKFFAHPMFKKEFTTDNVMGVYLPYMIVDANTHANLTGQGEHETKRWTEKNGDSYDTYYDADLYDVEREFDLTIESVPIHMPKLVLISALVEILGIIAMIFTKTDDNNWPWLFLLSGIIYFGIMHSRYRNSGARHSHETETKTNMTNLREYDKFVTKRKRLDNSTMEGANNTRVTGNSSKLDFKDFLKK